MLCHAIAGFIPNRSLSFSTEGFILHSPDKQVFFYFCTISEEVLHSQVVLQAGLERVSQLMTLQISRRSEFFPSQRRFSFRCSAYVTLYDMHTFSTTATVKNTSMTIIFRTTYGSSPQAKPHWVSTLATFIVTHRPRRKPPTRPTRTTPPPPSPRSRHHDTTKEDRHHDTDLQGEMPSRHRKEIERPCSNMRLHLHRAITPLYFIET